MHLLDCIETQLVCNRLPLVGITVAAVPYANTPFVLTLHWHGFVETRLADVTDANVVAYQPVPSSALQLNERWDRFEELENAVLDVAWELGAWRLERTDALPFIRPGASQQESARCLGAFGNAPVLIDGVPPVVAECPDSEGLVEAASRSGYHEWIFHPVRGGLWGEQCEDSTLQEGGYRNPPCPYLSAPAPTRRGQRRRTVFQLGKSDRLVR
ncbi:hypothetical protein BWI17_06730 [Betaproteobacteria bacterium GR16-43]|nr:hypothetical protein BWI17_06730 [Betaproteobacteria bacterium GR16-43]